jgi:hypothetical protein
MCATLATATPHTSVPTPAIHLLYPTYSSGFITRKRSVLVITGFCVAPGGFDGAGSAILPAEWREGRERARVLFSSQVVVCCVTRVRSSAPRRTPRRPRVAPRAGASGFAMEDLPHEQLVDLLRRVPRASLLDVAQTSTTLLRAASDDRLWRPTAARPDGVADPDGLAGTARRDGGAIRANVARWIATLLRFPHQAVLPLLRLETDSRFHVSLSCHPIRAHLAVAEALRPKTSSSSSPSPSRAHAHADLARRHPEDALLLSLGASDASSARRDVAAERESAAFLSEASANDSAARLADLLRDDADAARSNARGRGRGAGAQGSAAVGADVGAAVEAVRAERGRVRLRFAPEAIVALAVGIPTSPSRAPTTSAPTSAPVPPWTRGLDGVGVHASAGAVARLPRPATPWSTLRAAIVGESLRALDDGFGPVRFAERAWGPAARTVRAAADGRLHERLSLLLHEQNLAGVGSNPAPGGGGVVPADPRAGVAWPALAADPRLRGGVRTRDPSNPNRDLYHRGDRPRGFVVGGCACRESVAAVVDGALADADPSSFLDVDAGPPDPDERAAATALALLAHAPRAHECDLAGPRFARQLGRALWTLRLRRAKFAVGSEERERESSEAPSPTGTDPSNDRGYLMNASSSLGDADAALAIRLEACEGAVMDAGEQWEPREAAAAAIDVAGAAAGAAKAIAGRCEGDFGDDDGDDVGGDDGATRARRAMLRRARDCVERCLVAVGVLERLEGDG